MRLASFLLLLVAFIHYGYEPIALQYPDFAKSARAWFYVLRGFEGAALFAVVALLAAMLAALIKDWGAYPAIGLACLWGFFEEMQTAACRLSYPMDRPPPPDGYASLCGDFLGIPLYSIGIASGACIAVYIVALINKKVGTFDG